MQRPLLLTTHLTSTTYSTAWSKWFTTLHRYTSNGVLNEAWINVSVSCARSHWRVFLFYEINSRKPFGGVQLSVAYVRLGTIAFSGLIRDLARRYVTCLVQSCEKSSSFNSFQYLHCDVLPGMPFHAPQSCGTSWSGVRKPALIFSSIFVVRMELIQHQHSVSVIKS